MHVWFLHLWNKADFKKVQKVVNKMTKGGGQLPL